MPKLDRLKEELGFFKLIFSLFFVIVSSLSAWIYQQKNIEIFPVILDIVFISLDFVVLIKIKKLLIKIEKE